MSDQEARQAGLVAFHTFALERPEAAETVVTLLTGHAAGRLRGRPGFLSARVHRSVDGTKVVLRTLWRDRAGHDAVVAEDGAVPGTPAAGGGLPDAVLAGEFLGRPVPGITGPQAGESPGIVAIATRRLRDRDAFPALMGLLAGSEEWKRHHTGFIRATPYLGLDGTTFVNYPAWADEESYRAWMADPRLGQGQQEIARLESAPPEYLLCTVSADIGAD